MLSIIVVNHNSSDLLKQCYLSIISIIGQYPFEFLIIDSGSKKDEAQKLSELKSHNIRLILQKENIGYSKAVNIGINLSQGEYILITNPDVLYMADSIKVMYNGLSTLPKCGAVGPKTWWNKKMDFLLPISSYLTPYEIFVQESYRVSKALYKIILKNWIKTNCKYWFSTNPLEQKMLSGACIMTHRDIIKKVGGFDEIFPLYFEDADWCIRVRKSGYNLYMIPQAEIVHYYNQSAKKDLESSRQKFLESKDLYYNKHFKKQLARTTNLLKLHSWLPKKEPQIYKELGRLQSPPIFKFNNHKRKVLLLSPVETLMPSAGSFFEWDSFILPEDLWDCLGESRYYTRCFDLDTLNECGSWSWIKTE